MANEHEIKEEQAFKFKLICLINIIIFKFSPLFEISAQGRLLRKHRIEIYLQLDNLDRQLLFCKKQE